MSQRSSESTSRDPKRFPWAPPWRHLHPPSKNSTSSISLKVVSPPFLCVRTQAVRSAVLLPRGCSPIGCKSKQYAGYWHAAKSLKSLQMESLKPSGEALICGWGHLSQQTPGQEASHSQDHLSLEKRVFPSSVLRNVLTTRWALRILTL